MAAPKVQSLAQILSSLDPAYAPQASLITQQQKALPGQETAQLGALDAAKSNAFRDVNTNANSKGLAFSGIPASEQTRYIGEKYLPAYAGVKQATTQASLTLAQALAQLRSDQRLRALDTQGGQQKAQQDYLTHMQDQQFQAQQSALERAATRSSQAAKDVQNSTLVKNTKGGYAVYTSGGAPANLDLWQYVQSQGGGPSDLVSLLSEGDKQDQKAAANYTYNVGKLKMSPAKAFAQLQKDRSSAFYKSKK